MKASDILEVFRFQAQHTAVYARYLELLGVDPLQITSPEFIPFLPIRFFKSHTVYNGSRPPEHVFTSSATTGMAPSHHPVDSLERYGQGVLDTFRLFYGNPSAYTILALLPSYMERPGSSLVYMMQVLMKKSSGKADGFYLHNKEDLYRHLQTLAAKGKPVWLLGAAFALLDFAETYTVTHPGLTVVETGGMKGKGVELSRETLHLRLKSGFPSAPFIANTVWLNCFPRHTPAKKICTSVAHLPCRFSSATCKILSGTLKTEYVAVSILQIWKTAIPVRS